jgi:hypothetical protein
VAVFGAVLCCCFSSSPVHCYVYMLAVWCCGGLMVASLLVFASVCIEIVGVFFLRRLRYIVDF